MILGALLRSLGGSLCSLLLLPAEFRELGVGAFEEVAWMADAHDQGREEHGCGVEAVEVGFMVGEGIVGAIATGVFDETVDDAELDCH